MAQDEQTETKNIIIIRNIWTHIGHMDGLTDVFKLHL